MSERIYVSEDFDMGDTVLFNGPGGERLRGEIVRVYFTRDRYHVVDSDGRRYSVEPVDDDMVKE